MGIGWRLGKSRHFWDTIWVWSGCICIIYSMECVTHQWQERGEFW